MDSKAHIPFGLPPIFPDFSDQLESYLTKPERICIHFPENLIRFKERTPKPDRLMHTEISPLTTTISYERCPNKGNVVNFKEARLRDPGSTSKNSTSLRRRPGPPEEAARGSSNNYPFWPGGFDADYEKLSEEDTSSAPTETHLLSIPPGFDSGFDFGLASTDVTSKPEAADSLVHLTTLLSVEDEMSFNIWDQSESKQQDQLAESKPDAIASEGNGEENASLENLTKEAVLVISGSNQMEKSKSSEWAKLLDVTQPIPDFHQRVPHMAFTWPFELDTFQKQAVLCLENNESVFIAAHTSAGKTVVAEYAIALSQKHMTRSIYTSPIKALSNQKFRDFKDRFEDVGLVTGDIQINPTATCLIMTTEILRSMLYCGSDTIRDLEFVIFDEVHYINDAERGVVWEEVLILLPEHVTIIMLSATVPNYMEFADWVGRTKRKKINVVSTQKRPVPLEHFLYTGSNGKTRDERFLILDASGKLNEQGYKKAVQAKKERESKAKQQTGPKGVVDRTGPQQEKNIWLTLIDHLSRQDKLPVVAFTLSRQRCDQNANLLTSLDLTTAMEKTEIHHFIQKCINRLKDTDRKLPQVINLTDLLKRGIGIHHSGILPILKEVVEMLFQRGWVKLLFATETFAMGINMPTRTVVFDNIRKHDGKEFRTLHPAEYIQMAGRAGRRGLDTTGTVIILCKNQVHDWSSLSCMMVGRPKTLESQFRLTYTMILNLLRVEQLRVEDMMKRSFSELNSQKNQTTNKEKAKMLRDQLELLPVPKSTGGEIELFYSSAKEIFKIREEVWTLLLSHPQALKTLTPGRVILVNINNLINQLGVLLENDSSIKEKSYGILVLKSRAERSTLATTESKSFYDYLSLASQIPEFENCLAADHEFIKVKDDSILDITTKNIKVDPEKVISDIKKREIPRFKNDPPGPSTQLVIEELKKMYNECANGQTSPETINWIRDFKIRDISLLEKLQKIVDLKSKISKMILAKDGLQQFRTEFEGMHKYQELKESLDQAEFIASEASLKYLPDYHKRVDVLREMKYIDDNKTVQLKGRVACEMGNHELLITELIFNNVLTDRPVQEIVALLSCLVFQQRNCSEPTISPELKKGIAEIKDCAKNIGLMQKECGMLEPVQDYVDQFNFGLVEVVFEWAGGMPFSNITQLTDVQEGVIVRTIQRLDEVLRNVKDGARVIGDPVLYQKMDEASTLVKRDIVFAASLYLQ